MKYQLFLPDRRFYSNPSRTQNFFNPALILAVRNQGSCMWGLPNVSHTAVLWHFWAHNANNPVTHRWDKKCFSEMGWETEITWTFYTESKMKYTSCWGQTMETVYADVSLPALWWLGKEHLEGQIPQVLSISCCWSLWTGKYRVPHERPWMSVPSSGSTSPAVHSYGNCPYFCLPTWVFNSHFGFCANTWSL